METHCASEVERGRLAVQGHLWLHVGLEVNKVCNTLTQEQQQKLSKLSQLQLISEIE